MARRLQKTFKTGLEIKTEEPLCMIGRNTES
jgi:hypothetical protein